VLVSVRSSLPCINIGVRIELTFSYVPLMKVPIKRTKCVSTRCSENVLVVSVRSSHLPFKMQWVGFRT